MKNLIILLPLLTLLASCSSNDSSGTAQSDSNAVSNKEPTLVSNAELISDKYADNFLSCRKSAPDDLNRVLSKALTAKGVILYFHGGLSTDKYMREKLGPAIMQSMFTEDNLNGLYPIFVNYDAGVFDDIFPKEIINDPAYKELQSRILSRLNVEKSNKSLKTNSVQSDTQQAAMSILINIGVDNNNDLKSNFMENTEEENERFSIAVIAEQEELNTAATNTIPS